MPSPPRSPRERALAPAAPACARRRAGSRRRRRRAHDAAARTPRDVRVDQQRLGRVAHARALDLRVERRSPAPRRGRRARPHNVAVARRGVDHRDGRDLLERRLQTLAPARDDQVDDAALGRELGQLLATAARRPAPTQPSGSPAAERRRRRRSPPAPRWSARPSSSRAGRSRCPTSGTARRRRSSRSVAPRRRRRSRRAGTRTLRSPGRWAAGGRRSPRRQGRGSAAICATPSAIARDPRLVQAQAVEQRVAEARLARRPRMSRSFASRISARALDQRAAIAAAPRS